jgi:hypothetical protein
MLLQVVPKVAAGIMVRSAGLRAGLGRADRASAAPAGQARCAKKLDFPCGRLAHKLHISHVSQANVSRRQAALKQALTEILG